MQTGLFLVIEWQTQPLVDTAAADHVRQADGHIEDTGHLIRRSTNGHDRTLVMENHVYDVSQGAADAIIGRPFALDNAIGSTAHALVNGLMGRIIQRNPSAAAKLVQRNAADADL